MNEGRRTGGARSFLGLSVVLGASVAALMMFVAWQHNPQGAFHEETEGGRLVVHWVDWALVGASWFVPVVALSMGAWALASFVVGRRSSEP